ncbi:hypothetical protein [Xenorhabdus stockiae]|uniref:hypothetical protein n=1 Tax=Xenorhabdus stockiae TaxID=351614 RepID=UPI004062EA13
MKAKNKKQKKIILLGLSENNAKELLKDDYLGRKGFASYSLQNNNAEINRLKNRIKELENQKNLKEIKEEYESFIYMVDIEENRIKFIFDGKPKEEVRKILKEGSFKWSKNKNAWIRKITHNALYTAKKLKEKIQKL